MIKYLIIAVCALFVLTACEATNFDECVDAGNPVMESYPRQCKAGDKLFVEEIDDYMENVVEERHDCTETEKENKICTREYMPVCGDNKKTYATGCTACSSGEINSYIIGDCPELVGGDVDEHECKVSAGYSYNEEVNGCVHGN